MGPLRVDPVILVGDAIRLVALGHEHADGLSAVAEAEYFDYFLMGPHSIDEAGFHDYVDYLIGLPTVCPFAVIEGATNACIGLTCYLDIRHEHRALEVGLTWYARKFWGSAANPECKLLLLQHAFEVLGCVRVQLKTDSRNTHSQSALRKLGAQFEGRLRSSGIQPNGFVRDTMMYSILPPEWPSVKQGLLLRLGRSS